MRGRGDRGESEERGASEIERKRERGGAGRQRRKGRGEYGRGKEGGRGINTGCGRREKEWKFRGKREEGGERGRKET